MIILALDSSSKAASCALHRDGVLLGEFYLNGGLTHSQTLLPMVRDLLERASVNISQVELFAVSTGPGSFTGLRIGIAAVKGMASGLGAPCAPVSTLEGLAANLAFFGGAVIPVMDARRSQFYTAVFRCGDGHVQRITPDAALSAREVLDSMEKLTGPVMLVGDGAVLCRSLLDELGYNRPEGLFVAPEALRHQRAASIAGLAAELAARGRTCSAGELAPSYLRLPQAERERLARLGNRGERSV